RSLGEHTFVCHSRPFGPGTAVLTSFRPGTSGRMQRALRRRGRLCAATAKRKTGRYDLKSRIVWKWLGAASVIACLALIAAGCGGGGSSSSTTTAASGGSTSGKTFPNFRIAYDTGIDYLDPALSYTVQGWWILWNVYL